MKNLLNLKGAKLLSKVEQKSINGGAADLCIDSCGPGHPGTCGPNQVCHEFTCLGDPVHYYPVFYCVGEGPGNQ